MIASGSSERGIVRGDDRDVRVLRRDLPHQRALPPIAIASRAEDDDHATLPEVREPRAETVSSESGVCA